MATKLGPGVLRIGATGTEIDISCFVNSATITTDKDQGDSTTKLCGTVVPGGVTYTYTLTGNLDTDIEDPDGFFALSQLSPGSTQPFTFTPNSEVGTTAAGDLVIDPLDFGGDTMGDPMTSDFEFAVLGAPTYTYGVVPGALSADEAEAEPEPEPVGVGG